MLISLESLNHCPAGYQVEPGIVWTVGHFLTRKEDRFLQKNRSYADTCSVIYLLLSRMWLTEKGAP